MSDIVNKVIAFESGELDYDQVIEFFQELIDTNKISVLQGNYQRMAAHLLAQGLVTAPEAE